MIKLNKIYVLWLLLLSACGNSQDQESISEDQIVKIDLTQSSGGKLSEVFSNIHYTLIENSGSTPLVEPYQTVITENSFFFQDYFNSHLHEFDKTGNYTRIVKATGQGPKEYQQLDHFQVIGDTIFLLDRSLRKILGYNSEQVVVYEKFIPVNASLFFKQGGSILYFMNNAADKARSNFLLYRNDTLIQESVIIKPGFEKFQHGSKHGLSPDFNLGYVFPIPFSQEIAFFNKDLGFNKKVSFDFGSYAVKDLDFIRLHSSGREEYQDYIKKNHLVEDISSFTKLGKYYFMSLYQTDKGLHFIFLDENMHLIRQINNFENDIDQMRIRNIPWTIYENHIIFKINSVAFYNDYIKKFAGTKVEIIAGNVHDFFDKNQEKLKDDQTVLVSLELKETIN